MGEDQRDLDAIYSEFGLGDDAEDAIVREWNRMHKRGETIRVGDAPKNVARRWLIKYGEQFWTILDRKERRD
jgi:hypothetical protein